jgi:hypothetical protein
MSKNLATFSYVKPFTQAAAMPAEVLKNTGCLFEKHCSHFFPDA